MIDWLQQHWPWVVLVAVAPILWAIAVPALEIGFTVVGTALVLVWELAVGILKLPVRAFGAFVDGFQWVWRAADSAIHRARSLPDPWATSPAAPANAGALSEESQPHPKPEAARRRRRRPTASA